MGHRVERADRVKGSSVKLHIAHIRLYERGCRDVAAGPHNLLHRSVYPDDRVSQRREVPPDRNAGPTAKIENPATFGGQTFNQTRKPFLADGGNSEPIEIGTAM